MAFCFRASPNPAEFGKMRQGQRKMLGDGDVPLYDYLDALPAGLPLSVEIPIELGAGLRDVKARPYTARRMGRGCAEEFARFHERLLHRSACARHEETTTSLPA